jgi:hypothetical protein
METNPTTVALVTPVATPLISATSPIGTPVKAREKHLTQRG